MRLERNDEGVFLSASVQFDLPPLVEEAASKGIPVFFVAEAELLRDRWYWYDQRKSLVRRYMRLAYQPLTRPWRLQVSSAPLGAAGLGVSLGQTHDSLSDAMAAVQRIGRWKIAESAVIESDNRYNVEFRFSLDMSQLPRPIQLGASGRGDWSLAASRNMRLVMEPGR